MRIAITADDGAVARGFVDVSGMKKNHAGIWRCTGQMDAKAFRLRSAMKPHVGPLHGRAG